MQIELARDAPLLEVIPYSLPALIRILGQSSNTAENLILEKGHTGYFDEYFGERGVSAKTIVIERNYTDKDWLEDYADFYVRCLDHYRSRCTRLHFFNIPFTEHELLEAATGLAGRLTVAELQRPGAYLGFIVVKPIPNVCIGRTCLSTYEHRKDAVRKYITHTYKAHLLGMEFVVDSLPFQEQDTVAAACATSALWSAFHATGHVFDHSTLSPIHITRHATAVVHSIGRHIPNRGLSMIQMADAVRGAGLEPELIPFTGSLEFRAIVLAYLSAGVPIVMLGWLIDATDESHLRFLHDDVESGHAVTVVGYRLDPQPKVGAAAGNYPLSFQSSHISKIYVHDDQVGPFARMEIVDTPHTIHFPSGSAAEGGKCNDEDDSHNTVTFPFVLTTSWVNEFGDRSKVLFVPDSLLLPLYHKIRLPFRVPFDDYMLLLALEVEKKRSLGGSPFAAPVEWDLILTTNATIKERIRTKLLDEEEKWQLLSSQWPRFIWQITARSDTKELADFLLDATDVERGHVVLCEPLIYDRGFAQLLPE